MKLFNHLAIKPFSHSSRQRGFTFVELLVVVTIIVLLSAIGLASYSQVSKKSRDSKRKSDLEQIRAALEIYRSDQGVYPIEGSELGQLPATPCGGTFSDSTGAKIYMDPLPCDPKYPSEDYEYVYDQLSNTTYTLRATMEVDDDGGTCGSDLNYCVKQP